MKIIHVVGLISPQGEYGGPTRVAIEHATALTHLGHDVTIAAGTRGYDTPPNNINGVPTKLFRAHTPSRRGSLRALAAPELAIWLHTAAQNADIVHIHLGRDFVTMPAALAMRGTKTPYVLQTHGMVMPTHKTPIHALDKISTLPALRHAARILYLTPEERDGLINLDANINIEFLRNGIHTPQTPPPPRTTPQEVLFLARIHERKRPLDFIEAARRLAPQFPHITFRLIGPDEGQGTAVREAIATSGHPDRIIWDGPIPPETTREAIAAADIYVLPSVNEPYPMSVLEALALGTPTIITNTCGLAETITNGNAGTVIQPGPDHLTTAIHHLLTDTTARTNAAAGAYATARNHLDITTVATHLEKLYTTITQP